MNDITLQIVLAIIGSGFLGSIASGGVTLISKHIDKKWGNTKKLSELDESIKKMDKKLDEHIAQSYRNKILDFQNSCIRNERHTYEQFTEVLEAIQNYEDYCEVNKVKNEKCVMAIEYIKGIYRQCQSQSDFAPMSAQMINEDELKRMINNMQITKGETL